MSEFRTVDDDIKTQPKVNSLREEKCKYRCFKKWPLDSFNPQNVKLVESYLLEILYLKLQHCSMRVGKMCTLNILSLSSSNNLFKRRMKSKLHRADRA